MWRNLKEKNRRMLNRLIWKQRIYRKTRGFRREIREKISNHPDLNLRYNLDAAFAKASRDFLNRYFPGYKNLDWHYLYSSINEIKDINYIPEDLYYTKIEPGINSNILSIAYADKNSYQQHHDKEFLPETYIRIIGGQYYDPEYSWISENRAKKILSNIRGKCVFKPALISGQGRNVKILNKAEIQELLWASRNKFYNHYILQEYVNQHPDIDKICSSCLNTLRIITAKIGSNIVVLQSVIRFGRSKNSIDNLMSGGVVCGIQKNGRLTDYAFDKNIIKFEKHPDSGMPFKDLVVPGYQQACELCKRLHLAYAYFTVISWDIGIRKNEKPVLIEINPTKQGIFFHQIFRGPLFGEYTEHILEMAKENQWMYDFKNGLYFNFYA